jgi:hypothetical protein
MNPKSQDATRCDACGKVNFPKTLGFPDYTWSYKSVDGRKHPCYIEVKSSSTSSDDRIKLGSISDYQRTWMETHANNWFSFFFFVIGRGRVNGHDLNRTRSWLVPAHVWAEIENQIIDRELEQYVAIQAKPRMRQTDFLFTQSPLKEFELKWERGGWVMDSAVRASIDNMLSATWPLIVFKGKMEKC